MAAYSPARIEPKWQSAWEDLKVFNSKIDLKKPKYYVLEMFPYPSGRIHMGHVRNYTMGDLVARYKLSTGFNVLHPMGWDAFGMPAENAAMASNGHPKEWTYNNISVMKDQMKPLGLSIDWQREFATCDPEYYGQQQALFLDFLEAGLVYRKNAVVNWDPVDLTVLANEQVENGRGWRSGAVVERRELTQWFFKISEFSDDLLASIEKLDNWPAKVKLMQTNWIGESKGLEFAFNAVNAPDGFDKIEVYTTRPDTLLGASFVGISTDHPLARELEKVNSNIASFNAQCRQMSTSEAEMEIYKQIVTITKQIINEAFSLDVIQIGKTTTTDLEWWMRQKVTDLGLNTWFHPSVDIQRKSEISGDHLRSFSNRPAENIIMKGDLLHCDFGITYLRLNSDCQQMAYVLKDDEKDIPTFLRKAFSDANILQDILTSNFVQGNSGNEILLNSLSEAKSRGLRPSIYTHPLGSYGHSSGPTIGMWDSQGGVVGTGDYPLNYNTVYAIELNNTSFIKEWNRDIRIMLEEAGFFDENGHSYVNGRQTGIKIINPKQ